jgi:hypothetical protein
MGTIQPRVHGHPKERSKTGKIHRNILMIDDSRRTASTLFYKRESL